MRYGIISDIHGNLEALAAVLPALAAEKVGALLVAGDEVGYGADPVGCLKQLRQVAAVHIAGNHDWAAVEKFPVSLFSSFAHAALLWTRTQLADEEKDYLRGLPLVYQNDDLVMVHGTLDRPAEFQYLRNESDAAATFALMERKICFVGHTHVPAVFCQNGTKIYPVPFAAGVFLEEQTKYIVNVGSVGQPRDGNPLACYCVFDTAGPRVTLKRVPYQISKAQEKILQAGLPSFLATRLASGI